MKLIEYGVQRGRASGASLFVACVATAALTATLIGCGGGSTTRTPAPPPPPTVPPTYTPSGKAANGETFVHLFEWRWTDVATECVQWLGPKGFAGVQVSPPSEHAVLASSGFPWWQRYQTVSYKLDQSRSGTAAEFKNMVASCQQAGVQVYADAVINHMTAGAGTGSAGSAYTKYSYPAVPYVSTDFHAACAVSNYLNESNVQNCELVGLADLKTEADGVRSTIANYLIALNTDGVAGFRIDAAKHIPAYDIDQILTKVNTAAALANPARARPYVFLEIIDNGGEAVTPDQYFGVGHSSGGASDITEFQYGYQVSDAFLGRNGATLNSLFSTAVTGAGLLPNDKAVVFTDNHDNQRSGNIYYASTPVGNTAVPNIYELAAIYTLAQPWGVVSLMSSYGFDISTQAGRDAGPPGANGVTQSVFDAQGNSLCTTQFGSPQVGGWICEHRSRAIANMVAFRKATAGAPLSTCGQLNWMIKSDPNRIAFCRDTKGFVAISRSGTSSVETLSTSLPSGTYCNVIASDFDPTNRTACSSQIVVGAGGVAQVTVPAYGAIALHVGAQIN